MSYGGLGSLACQRGIDCSPKDRCVYTNIGEFYLNTFKRKDFIILSVMSIVVNQWIQVVSKVSIDPLTKMYNSQKK